MKNKNTIINDSVQSNRTTSDGVLHDKDIVAVYIDYDDPDYDEVFARNVEIADREIERELRKKGYLDM